MQARSLATAHVFILGGRAWSARLYAVSPQWAEATKHITGTSRYAKPGTTSVITSSRTATSHTTNVAAATPQHHAAAISNSG
jgi:hypothetical protein